MPAHRKATLVNYLESAACVLYKKRDLCVLCKNEIATPYLLAPVYHFFFDILRHLYACFGTFTTIKCMVASASSLSRRMTIPEDSIFIGWAG